MGSSAVLLAKRALVALIRQLATVYGLTVSCCRDSSDQVIRTSFRKVALRAHPDHGGNSNDQQRLNDARAVWDEALKKKVPAGRPKVKKTTAADGDTQGLMLTFATPGDADRKGYRVHAQAAMLTYLNFTGDLAQWRRFDRPIPGSRHIGCESEVGIPFFLRIHPRRI